MLQRGQMIGFRSPLCALALLLGCGGSESGPTPSVAVGSASGAGTSRGETSGAAGDPGASGSGDAAESCSGSAPLSGATYDISKSRFAFGSSPSAENDGSFVRWIGSDGVVGISSDGSELGIMNAGAPETNLPDWSADPSKLSAHAIDYWVSMGVATCQIANANIDGSGSGGGSIDGGFTLVAGPSTVVLSRGVGGVPVAESLAVARFDVNDQTTDEAFYWPAIPAAVVSSAVTFKNELADPSALAAYKAKLPADAQGQGQVVIHHTSAGSSSPFQSAATYDVVQSLPPDDGGGLVFGGEEDLSFDPDANPVTTAW